jgi:hypothetical protein
MVRGRGDTDGGARSLLALRLFGMTMTVKGKT